VSSNLPRAKYGLGGGGGTVDVAASQHGGTLQCRLLGTMAVVAGWIPPSNPRFMVASVGRLPTTLVRISVIFGSPLIGGEANTAPFYVFRTS
jgi:hypothetical protein